MTPNQQQSICEEYKLGTPLSSRQLGGTRNRNFLLTTSTGQWFVRHRYHGYSDSHRIAFDHAALKYLHNANAPVVAPSASRDRKTFFQSGDETWEVFPGIHGREFREGDADDLQAMARSLAAFHVAGRSFEPRYEKIGARGETDPNELLQFCEHLADYAPAQQRFRQWVQSASQLLTSAHIASLPHTLVHGDVQPANVLIDDKGRAIFVDLDWCAWRMRIYDIAFAMLLCCSHHPSPIRGEDIWSLTQPARILDRETKLFLDTYNQSGWPIDTTEQAALRPQIILSWCHCRLAGAMKVEPHRRQEFLDRPPRELGDLFSESAL